MKISKEIKDKNKAIKEKLLKKLSSDPDALSEEEIISLLVLLSDRNVDCQLTTEEILYSFSLRELFGTTTSRLLTCEVMGKKTATLVHLYRTLYDRIKFNSLKGTRLLEFDEWGKFFCDFFSNEKNEKMVIVSVNKQGKIVDFQVHLNFMPNSLILNLCLISRFISSHPNTAFVLAHNHPSGNPKPSQSDYESTNRLLIFLSSSKNILLEHFTVSRNEYRGILKILLEESPLELFFERERKKQNK